MKERKKERILSPTDDYSLSLQCAIYTRCVLIEEISDLSYICLMSQLADLPDIVQFCYVNGYGYPCRCDDDDSYIYGHAEILIDASQKMHA